MIPKKIWFQKNDDESYDVVDLHIDSNRFFGYKDAYFYYDIDVKRILLIKNGYNKSIIRYYDVNKRAFVPLQLKIKNFFYDIREYDNGDEIMYIENNDK